MLFVSFGVVGNYGGFYFKGSCCVFDIIGFGCFVMCR